MGNMNIYCGRRIWLHNKYLCSVRILFPKEFKSIRSINQFIKTRKWHVINRIYWVMLIFLFVYTFCHFSSCRIMNLCSVQNNLNFIILIIAESETPPRHTVFLKIVSKTISNLNFNYDNAHFNFVKIFVIVDNGIYNSSLTKKKLLCYSRLT